LFAFEAVLDFFDGGDDFEALEGELASWEILSNKEQDMLTAQRLLQPGSENPTTLEIDSVSDAQLIALLKRFRTVLFVDSGLQFRQDEKTGPLEP
jgi:hypothetical protein